MTDFIIELTTLINSDIETLLPAKKVTIEVDEVKKLVIAAADNTLKAAVAGGHRDATLTKTEIAYIVAALTVGINPSIRKGLKPKR
ncbi:MAG: hypothetical protein HC875_41180 [Anaerolineales bacterium]|nr:hypothetical protein [Anaerolineales bacterium]